MLSLLLLTALISLASCWTEQAPYEVLQEFEGFEMRKYPAIKWISTDAQDVMPHDGAEHRKAFYRLFNYIDGSNDAKTKIPMTAPVTMQIIPGEGPNCESNYTMSFFIPTDFQSPPLSLQKRGFTLRRGKSSML